VWSEVDSPNVAGNNSNGLNDVGVVSANDVWAVGDSYDYVYPNLSPMTTLIEHWDGSQWTIIPSPNGTITGTNILNAVAAVSANDVWAGGSFYSRTQYGLLLLHWNGVAWSMASVPSVAGDISDLAALSADDVWAVGATNGYPSQSLAMHWNGNSWSVVSTPALQTGNGLLTVVAVATNNVWAVGHIGASSSLFLHWDGSAWTQFNNPSPLPGILQSAAALSANDIWAVGYKTDGSGRPLTAHYDGTSWNAVDVPQNIPSNLSGVVAISSSDVWTSSGNNLVHWDGTGWSPVPGAVPPPGAYYAMIGLGALSSTDIWAVGDLVPPSSTGQQFLTLTEQYRNNCPQPTATSTVTSTPNASFTPTRAATNTPTPTATPTNYVIVQSTGTIVPGTTDTGNHCDDCTTLVRLPFPSTLYDQRFSVAIVGSNGTLGFVANANPATNGCVATAAANFAIFPYWDDLTTSTLSCSPCGIFTSISGSSPSRIFNIEWRAMRIGGSFVNFEVRLYEGSSRFDLVYGRVDPGASESIGVQRDTGSLYTRVLCLPGGAPEQPSGAEPAKPSDRIIDAGTLLAFVRENSQPTPTPTACTIHFSDVPPGSTFYAYIECLACRGIVSGYSDGSFKPGNQVTRGQLAKMVSNAVGLNDDPGGDQLFLDVPPGSTFYDFVQRLGARGYMSGYACGGQGEPCGPGNLPYFRPGGTATRGQIAKIVSNAASFSDGPSGQSFQDVPPDSTFFDFIQRLSMRNIINGYACGGPGEPCVPPGNLPYFRPNGNVTRGQTSKIVSNTFYPGCQTP
jgi:hypothetical protein